jgi:hypothetical protein
MLLCQLVQQRLQLTDGECVVASAREGGPARRVLERLGEREGHAVDLGQVDGARLLRVRLGALHLVLVEGREVCVLSPLEGVVERRKDLDARALLVGPEVDGAKGSSDRRVRIGTAHDKKHLLGSQETLDADERLGRRKVQAADEGKVDDQEADGVVVEMGDFEELADLVLDDRDGAEEEESVELHDHGLRADALDERTLLAGTADGRLCGVAGKDCTDRTAAGALDDKEDARENDTDEEASDKVKERHARHDGDDGKVLEAVDAVTSVPDRLDNEVETKHEDEGANDHDGFDGSVMKRRKGYSRRDAMTVGPTHITPKVAAARRKPDRAEPPPTR